MTTTTHRAETAPTTRLAFVDNLRVALTILVVAHHVALAYGNLGLWPNWEQPPSEVAGLPLDIFVLVNQTFFMGFFFLLSGLLVPRSADRRGAGGFARERLRRLGIPFVVSLIVIRPLYALPEYLDQSPVERGPYWEFFFTNWNIGPLWFLEVLLAVSLGYALLRRGRPSGREIVSTPLRPRHIVLFALALGLVSYAWRTVMPIGEMLLGIPSAAYLPQYVALFAVGALAYRRGWFTALPRRAGLLGTGLLIASFLPMVFLGGVETLEPDHGLATTSLPQFGFALWDSLFAFGAILVLIVIFQRHVTGDGPLAQFLSRNAFAVYLLHAPVIVGIVALTNPLDLPPFAKFGIVLPISLVVTWTLAALMRRIPKVRSIV